MFTRDVRRTVDREAWRTECRIVPTVRSRGVPVSTPATFAVESGRGG